MPWYELETRTKLMRFTLPRLFNIAHFQNQRKTVVLCKNALHDGSCVKRCSPEELVIKSVHHLCFYLQM
jgi:hypothetical protein